jgi:hypothetical protein
MLLLWRQSDYRPSFVQDYIAATSPAMAVGEFWTDCNYDEAGKLVYDQDSHRQARPCAELLLTS